MIDISELDTSQYSSNVELSLKAAVDAGFKGTINPSTLIGTLKLHGIEVEVSIGSENVYFTLPEVFIKESPTEGMMALFNFLGVFSNICGSCET